MKINIKKTNTDLNAASQDLYLKKIQEIGKFFKRDQADSVVDFEVGKSTMHHEHGEVFFAKAHINGPGRDYYAESQAESIDLAFHDMKEKLIREIRRDKDKMLTWRKKMGKLFNFFKK